MKTPEGHGKRILLLGSYAPSLLTFRGPFIARMVAGGHEVHAGAPDIEPDQRIALEKLQATVHETPLRRTGRGFFNDIRYMAGLFFLMRKIRPDLVVTYTIKPNIWGGFAARLAGIKSAAMVTGLGFAFAAPEEGQKREALTRFLAVRLYGMSANSNWRLIFQNPDDPVEFTKATRLTDPSKIRLTNGSGVDLDEFSPAPLPDKPVFLMIARLLRAKGVYEFVNAARLIRETHPEARFCLVGPFDAGPDAIGTGEFENLNGEGAVEYLGPAADVRPHMAACRVYVLPSYREGAPRSVLEAMAMGRPVLTTDVPGCRETVVDGVNGFLVPGGSVDSLAKKMAWMIEHPEQTAKMGMESRKIAREKFDVNQVNTCLLAHLEIAG